MKTSSDYFAQFTAKLHEQGVDKEIKSLFHYASSLKQDKMALGLMKIFPGSANFTGAPEFAIKVKKEFIELKRTKLSGAVISSLESIWPAKFSSCEETRQFELMTYEVEGEILDKKHREQLLKLRQRARSTWQNMIHKLGVKQRNELLRRFEAQDKAQKKFHQYMKNISQQQLDAYKKITQRLAQLQANSDQQGQVLSQRLTNIQKQLANAGIKIDKQTMLLLQSDVQIQVSLSQALSYLERQEQREVRAQAQQERMAEYQGALDGFALLNVIGKSTNSRILQQFSVVGTEAVKIHMAISQLATMSGGLAILSPIAAIGYSIMTLVSSFIGGGVSESAAIQKMLVQLAERIDVVRKEMHQRFDGLHEHLAHLELVITHGFQQLYFQFARPTLDKLDLIQSQLQDFAKQTEDNFKLVMLDELINLVNKVDAISQEVLPKPSHVECNEIMLKLSSWIMTKSANPQFTGMRLAKLVNNQVHWTGSPQHRYRTLANNANIQAILPLLIAVTSPSGVHFEPDVAIPHIGIWSRAVQAYLTMRESFNDVGQQRYDPKNKNLTQIMQQADAVNESVTQLFTNQKVLQYHIEQLQEQLHTLSQQHGEYYKQLSLFEALTNLRANPSLLLQSIDQIITTQYSNQVFSSDIVSAYYLSPKMNYKGSREAYASEIQRQLEFMQVGSYWCMEQIINSAKSIDVAPFSPALIFAEHLKLARVTLNFENLRILPQDSCNQFVASGRDESKFFGSYFLNVIIEIEHQKIPITVPYHHDFFHDANYHIPMSASDKDSHLTLCFTHPRKIFAFEAKFDKAQLNRVNQLAHKLIMNKLSQARTSYLESMRVDLAKQDSALYRACLRGQLLTIISKFHLYKLDDSISDLMTSLNKVEQAISDPTQFDARTLVDFFSEQLPTYIDALESINLEPKKLLEGEQQSINTNLPLSITASTVHQLHRFAAHEIPATQKQSEGSEVSSLISRVQRGDAVISQSSSSQSSMQSDQSDSKSLFNLVSGWFDRQPR